MNAAQRERERSTIERREYAELQDAYEHRGDSMAALRTYEARFRKYQAFINDGKVGTGRLSILRRLRDDEGRLQRERAAIT